GERTGACFGGGSRAPGEGFRG
ncbi:MAG: hypothetical protein AVDCRST_MAG01-01-1064, partial [uncultured Rubrobacteraceae bacterium]